MAKVTVLLFSYNHEKFVAECIGSVLNQTFRDFELWIIDDCSTDRTWEIIGSFDDPRIHAMQTPKNLGAEWMYDGIDRFGNGEYIAVHNSDDCWKPEKLEKQVAYLDAHPECGAVFTGADVIDEDGKLYGEKNRFYSDVFKTENKSRAAWLRQFFLEGNSLCASSVMARRTLFGSAGLKMRGIFSVPDFLQWVRVCRTAEIHILPEHLSCYRVRDAERNISGDTPQGHIRFAFENFILLLEYLKADDDLILQAFPELEAYRIGTVFLKDYAFARFLLEKSSRGECRFLALLILYGLLNEDETAQILRDAYRFEHADFAKLTGKYDVFHIIAPEQYQKSTVFYKPDADGAYSEANCITQNNYILTDGTFRVAFDLGGAAVQAIRFDPDEGVFRCFENVSVKLDGESFTMHPVECAKTSGTGTEFYTADPQLELILDQARPVHCVEFAGKTSLLPMQKIHEEFSDYRGEKAQLENRVTQLGSRIAQLDSRLADTEGELERTYQNLAASRAEQTQERKRYLEAERNNQILTQEFEARRNYLKNHRLKAAVKAILGKLWSE